MRNFQRRVQRGAESRLCQHKGNFVEISANFFNNKTFKRAHIGAAIAHSALKAMEKPAQPAAYAPINNVLIAVSATKTPSVFNIQTVSRCVSAKPVMLAMGLVRMAAWLLLRIPAISFDVAMVELA